MKKLIFPFLIFLSFYSIKSFAQETTPNDNSYYFDDDGVSEARNLIKFNSIATLSGEVSFSYERILSKTFTVEFRTGLIMPHYIPDYYEVLEYSESVIKNEGIKGGYSIGVQPKIYYFKAPELAYTGLQLRRRVYNLETQSLTYSDIYIVGGIQKIIMTRMVIDFSTGVGFRLKTFEKINPNDEQSNKELTLVLPLALKIGYIF